MVGSVLFLGLVKFITHGGVRPLLGLMNFLTRGGVRPLFRTFDSSRLVVRFTQQGPERPFIKFDLVEENTCPFLG